MFMKNIYQVLIVAICLLIIGCSSNKLKDNSQILFNPEEASMVNLETSGDAKIAIVKDKNGENVLQFSCDGNDKAPGSL